MRMRTCLIYGNDGFDVDVLLNLQAFYTSLGFTVAHSRSLVPADLLVIQRIPDAPLSLDGYADVHLFDYVGTPYPRLLRALRCADTNVAVFCSSSARQSSVRAHEPALHDRVHVQLPPVEVDLWVAPPAADPRRYRAVHIGHYKPYYREMTDPYSTAFVRALERFDEIRVWGTGWEGARTVAKSRPRLALRSVSGTYARSTTALGMMFPHQREITLSGRFWHAPLNGCRLVSEPSVFAGSLPGVIATDYSIADVSRLLDEKVDAPAVQDAAVRHWRAAYASARELVSTAITPPDRRARLDGRFCGALISSRARAVLRRALR